ncbi:hypothetical protein BgiBS90_028959 [Biomphalaria glabrata]|nr:hypothetical protein BgiBS90_028959 [Biomphalaria glabrata]
MRTSLSLLKILALVSVCHSIPELTISIVNPELDATLDTKLPAELISKLYTTLCESGGSHNIVRTKPEDGRSGIIEEGQRLNTNSRFVTSCMFEDSPPNKTCSFCEANRACVAEIRSSCSPSDMRSMQYVDVTLSTSFRELVVDNCEVLCQQKWFRGDEPIVSASSSISDLAVGLVAGVIVLASLLVAGAVICKIKDSKSVREEYNDNHFTHSNSCSSIEIM